MATDGILVEAQTEPDKVPSFIVYIAVNLAKDGSHMKPIFLWLLRTVAALLVIVVPLSGAAQQNPKFTTDSEEQYHVLAEAMKQNSYPISLRDGTLLGPGMQLIVRNTATSQFVLFGEEHGVKEFPELLTALFAFLHENDQYNYIAVESDPVSAHVASIAPLRGDIQALAEYFKKYPNAITFHTDQELRMFADIGRMSTGRTDAIWGLDQSFGVLHALERLAALPGFRATPKFEELHKDAEKLDSTRLQGEQSHYMYNVKLADLEDLRREIAAPDGSEAKFILDNLVSSSEIYGYYRRAVAGEPTGYANGFEREEQMKHLFMRQYRAAVARGESNPKVLVKLGHWHVFRGQGPSHLQTLGNFVTEFATANGADAFSLGVYLRGTWRDVTTQKGLEPIALATDPAAWTIIDFRSLRPAIAAGRFGPLNAKLLAHIYGFDAALVLGGASPGTDLLLSQPAHQPH